MKDLSKSQWLHLVSLLLLLTVVPISAFIIKVTENHDTEKFLTMVISFWFILEGLVIILTKKFVKRREFIELGTKTSLVYGAILIGFAVLVLLSL